MIEPMPIKYAEAAISGDPPNTAPAISPMIGSLAPHGMNVVVITVSLRSLSCSIVREAMIPGIPQPVATRHGMKLLPESPNCLKIRSITNATLLMYPISSSIASSRKSTIICGTNPSTAPTPATIPFWTSPYSHVSSATPIDASTPSRNPGTHSPKITSLVKSVAAVPMETDQLPIAMAYTKNMMTPNIGSPSILLVTILSILSDTVRLSSDAAFLTELFVISAIALYLSFVMMLSESSSSFFSHASMILSISGALAPSLSCSITFSSRSKTLIAYQRSSFASTRSLSESSIFPTASSVVSENLTASAFPCPLAALIARSAALSIPWPLSALISTTLHPRALPIFAVSMESPFFFTRSIMLTASTTGMPSSISCVVRYRFLSILVPSTMFRIASGRSFTR